MRPMEAMPAGFVSNVILNRDANGRLSAEWPDGAIGCLVSRELLDQMIEEHNDRIVTEPMPVFFRAEDS